MAYFTKYAYSQLSADPENSEKIAPSPETEADGTWIGTCVHSTTTRSTLPFDPAVEIALNPRFSVVALGLKSGQISFVSYPAHGEALLPPTVLQLPDISVRGKSGPVTCMEWTTDGYALAIGWENGWAVLSVGGRFLAWVIGTKGSSPWLQDKFMHGVSSLVGRYRSSNVS